MKINFIPKTKLGKWSFGLIIAMPISFFVGLSLMNLLYPSAPGGNTILEDIINRPGLAIAMLLGMACGISSFIIGLIAIIKKKEKALLVYAAIIIGALLVLFLVGEFVSPH